MKEYIIKEGAGELLIHMTASNENYTISYDRGQLKFQNINKTYIIPKDLGHKVIYDKLDTLTNKNKYLVEDIRTLYRDTTPTDFGLTNKTNVSPGSKHTSEEIIVGGINDYIPVVAPEGVKIYVNGNIVGSGTMIYNGDRVKFELIAPSTNGAIADYNLRVGDISKNVSIQTSNIVLPISPTTLSYYGYRSGSITFSGTIYLLQNNSGVADGVNIDLNDLTVREFAAFNRYDLTAINKYNKNVTFNLSFEVLDDKNILFSLEEPK